MTKPTYAVLFSHAPDGELRGPFADLRAASDYGAMIDRAANVEHLVMRSDDDGATWRPVLKTIAVALWWYTNRKDRKVVAA